MLMNLEHVDGENKGNILLFALPFYWRCFRPVTVFLAID